MYNLETIFEKALVLRARLLGTLDWSARQNSTGCTEGILSFHPANVKIKVTWLQYNHKSYQMLDLNEKPISSDNQLTSQFAAGLLYNIDMTLWEKSKHGVWKWASPLLAELATMAALSTDTRIHSTIEHLCSLDNLPETKMNRADESPDLAWYPEREMSDLIMQCLASKDINLRSAAQDVIDHTGASFKPKPVSYDTDHLPVLQKLITISLESTDRIGEAEGVEWQRILRLPALITAIKGMGLNLDSYGLVEFTKVEQRLVDAGDSFNQYLLFKQENADCSAISSFNYGEQKKTLLDQEFWVLTNGFGAVCALAKRSGYTIDFSLPQKDGFLPTDYKVQHAIREFEERFSGENKKPRI